MEIEQPAARPLPIERFDLSTWSQATVKIDFHTQFDFWFDSDPYLLSAANRGVWDTPATEDIFQKGQRVTFLARTQAL